MAAFSLDLRERIVAAVDAGESSLAGVAARFAVSLGLVKKLLASVAATVTSRRWATAAAQRPCGQIWKVSARPWRPIPT